MPLSCLALAANPHIANTAVDDDDGQVNGNASGAGSGATGGSVQSAPVFGCNSNDIEGNDPNIENGYVGRASMMCPIRCRRTK
ncbi:hypothetical protein TSMEX_004577 [Taenia solium]|eukprot:TsM_001159200 transcript=TsM_001159200 gene=TsM_001159200